MESVYPPPTSRGHNQTGLMTGGVRLSPEQHTGLMPGSAPKPTAIRVSCFGKH